jgi:tubulin-specific chaperone C
MSRSLHFPSFGQALIEPQKMKALEASLEARRSITKPVSKFAFKKKQPTSASKPIKQAPSKSLVASDPSASNEFVYTLSSQSNVTISSSSLSSFPSSGLSISLSHLTSCTINLMDLPPSQQIQALYATNLTKCIIIIPSIQGSAILHHLMDSILAFECQQVSNV